MIKRTPTFDMTASFPHDGEAEWGWSPARTGGANQPAGWAPKLVRLSYHLFCWCARNFILFNHFYSLSSGT